MTSKNFKAFIFILVVLLLEQNLKCDAQFTQLGLISQWKEIDFTFPSIEYRQLALLQGKYIRGNSVPIDMDVDYSGKQSSVPTQLVLLTTKFSVLTLCSY